VSEQLLIAKLTQISSEIKHEDDLISQRTTWLVISQSFLFGTFVAVLALKPEAGLAAAFAKLLVVVIPLVGVLLPVVILLALYAAGSAIQQWRAEHDRLCGTPEGKALDWPRLKHRTAVVFFGHLLPITVAAGFTLAWVVIMITLGIV
jgi:hypothetical protein